MTDKPRDPRVDIIDMEAVETAFTKFEQKGPVDKLVLAQSDAQRNEVKERVRAALFQPDKVGVSPKALSVVICDGATEENRVMTFDYQLRKTFQGIVNFAAPGLSNDVSKKPVRRSFPMEVDRHVMGFSTLLKRRKQRELFAHETEQLKTHMKVILDYLDSLKTIS